MSFLRIWLVGSALVLGLVMVWAFVPILIPIAVIAAGLGALAAGMVSIARAIERRRGTVVIEPDQDEGKPPV